MYTRCIYGILASKSPNVRSYMVIRSGQPYTLNNYGVCTVSGAVYKVNVRGIEQHNSMRVFMHGVFNGSGQA